MAFTLPLARGVLQMNSILGMISSLLWLGTIWLPYGRRQGLIWVANMWGEFNSLLEAVSLYLTSVLPKDITGHLVPIVLMRILARGSKPLHKRALKMFEYYPGEAVLLPISAPDTLTPKS